MYKFKTPVSYSIPQPPPPGDEFFEKLLEFYKKQPDRKPIRSVIWEVIEGTYLGKLEAALDAGDIPTLKAVLANLYPDNALFGMDERHPAGWVNECINTAICVGALKAINPEQEIPDQELDLEEVIVGIENAIGGPLHHPGGAKMPGVELRNRFIPTKLLEAARVYWTVRNLDNFPMLNVLEIGAGCGFMAYLFKWLNSGCGYHTFDLPLASVVQSYLLACAEQTRVVIHGLDWPEKERFDVVINMNSMPEMPQDVLNGYLGTISDQLYPSEGYFLSINHESPTHNQTSVFSAMRQQPDMRLITRTPWWGREGYLQEIWMKR